MKVLILLVLAAVLGCSQAQLPMIGKCSYTNFTLDVRSCNTEFIRSMMKDPKSDCTNELKNLTDCAVNTIKVCMPPGTNIALIKMMLQQMITKEMMCDKAGVQFPGSMGPNASLPCKLSEKEYTDDINNCSNKMLSLWTANRADPKICGEYKVSKDCVRDVIDSQCDYSSIDWFKTLMTLTLGDYNPFCTNGVDPTSPPTAGPPDSKTTSNPMGGSPGIPLSGLLFVLTIFVTVALG